MNTKKCSKCSIEKDINKFQFNVNFIIFAQLSLFWNQKVRYFIFSKLTTNLVENSMQKTALITGVTGQDGAYLAEFLLQKGYFVHGVKRRSSSFNTDRIDHLYQDPQQKKANLKLHYGDLTDSTNLIRIIQETQPDEI